VGSPILINAISVAFGFSVMLFSNFVPMRFLGALIGLSMLSCAFGALTVMAAAAALFLRSQGGSHVS
jgi:predicted RND superfamily exporter protein